MLKQIIKFIKVLGSETKPQEIALGAVIGMFAAFVSGSLFNLMLFLLLVLLIRANFPVFIICLGVFKLAAIGIDPLGHITGKAVLTTGFLQPFWKLLSNIPVIPLTFFNNTVIMGDFIIAIVLTPLVWVGAKKFTLFYREKLKAKVDKLKIVQALKIGRFAGRGMK